MSDDPLRRRLRTLARKWQSRANHPQYSRNPEMRDLMRRFVMDLEDVLQENMTLHAVPDGEEGEPS